MATEQLLEYIDHHQLTLERNHTDDFVLHLIPDILVARPEPPGDPFLDAAMVWQGTPNPADKEQWSLTPAQLQEFKDLRKALKGNKALFNKYWWDDGPFRSKHYRLSDESLLPRTCLLPTRDRPSSASQAREEILNTVASVGKRLVVALGDEGLLQVPTAEQILALNWTLTPAQMEAVQTLLMSIKLRRAFLPGNSSRSDLLDAIDVSRACFLVMDTEPSDPEEANRLSHPLMPRMPSQRKGFAQPRRIEDKGLEEVFGDSKTVELSSEPAFPMDFWNELDGIPLPHAHLAASPSTCQTVCLRSSPPVPLLSSTPAPPTSTSDEDHEGNFGGLGPCSALHLSAGHLEGAIMPRKPKRPALMGADCDPMQFLVHFPSSPTNESASQFGEGDQGPARREEGKSIEDRRLNRDVARLLESVGEIEAMEEDELPIPVELLHEARKIESPPLSGPAPVGPVATPKLSDFGVSATPANTRDWALPKVAGLRALNIDLTWRFFEFNNAMTIEQLTGVQGSLESLLVRAGEDGEIASANTGLEGSITASMVGIQPRTGSEVPPQATLGEGPNVASSCFSEELDLISDDRRMLSWGTRDERFRGQHSEDDLLSQVGQWDLASTSKSASASEKRTNDMNEGTPHEGGQREGSFPISHLGHSIPPSQHLTQPIGTRCQGIVFPAPSVEDSTSSHKTFLGLSPVLECVTSSRTGANDSPPKSNKSSLFTSAPAWRTLEPENEYSSGDRTSTETEVDLVGQGHTTKRSRLISQATPSRALEGMRAGVGLDIQDASDKAIHQPSRGPLSPPRADPPDSSQGKSTAYFSKPFSSLARRERSSSRRISGTSLARRATPTPNHTAPTTIQSPFNLVNHPGIRKRSVFGVNTEPQNKITSCRPHGFPSERSDVGSDHPERTQTQGHLERFLALRQAPNEIIQTYGGHSSAASVLWPEKANQRPLDDHKVITETPPPPAELHGLYRLSPDLPCRLNNKMPACCSIRLLQNAKLRQTLEQFFDITPIDEEEHSFVSVPDLLVYPNTGMLFLPLNRLPSAAVKNEELAAVDNGASSSQPEAYFTTIYRLASQCQKLLIVFEAYPPRPSTSLLPHPYTPPVLNAFQKLYKCVEQFTDFFRADGGHFSCGLSIAHSPSTSAQLASQWCMETERTL